MIEHVGVNVSFLKDKKRSIHAKCDLLDINVRCIRLIVVHICSFNQNIKNLIL